MGLAQDIVARGRVLANYAHSCGSSIDGRGRSDTQEERELRQLLKGNGSLFCNTKYKGGIRRCPYLTKGEPCKGRHCEPWWKPILKQEQRKGALCGEDCKFCHDPRCFPDDEWVKLHVHRTPAARKREAKKKQKLQVQEDPSSVSPAQQPLTIRPRWADMYPEDEVTDEV